jgi:hypothetical protein
MIAGEAMRITVAAWKTSDSAPYCERFDFDAGCASGM